MEPKQQRWNFVSMNDRLLILDKIGVIGPVAAMIARQEWQEVEPEIQKQIMEIK